MNHNPAIDAIKGLLISLVVIGHILLGSLGDNIIRYLIYSFHMPAFFFVSGYLINIENLKKTSIGELIKKYWDRMLFMWVVAWIIYTAYNIYTVTLV